MANQGLFCPWRMSNNRPPPIGAAAPDCYAGAASGGGATSLAIPKLPKCRQFCGTRVRGKPSGPSTISLLGLVPKQVIHSIQD